MLRHHVFCPLQFIDGMTSHSEQRKDEIRYFRSLCHPQRRSGLVCRVTLYFPVLFTDREFRENIQLSAPCVHHLHHFNGKHKPAGLHDEQHCVDKVKPSGCARLDGRGRGDEHQRVLPAEGRRVAARKRQQENRRGTSRQCSRSAVATRDRQPRARTHAQPASYLNVM